MQFIDSLIPPVLREDMLPAEPSTTGDSVIDVRPTPKGTDTHTHTHTNTCSLANAVAHAGDFSVCVTSPYAFIHAGYFGQRCRR